MLEQSANRSPGGSYRAGKGIFQRRHRGKPSKGGAAMQMISRAAALNASTVYFRRDLPTDAGGAIHPNRQLTRFMILINATRPAADQARTLEHELAHIRLGHFDPEQAHKPVMTKEAEADQLADKEVRPRRRWRNRAILRQILKRGHRQCRQSL